MPSQLIAVMMPLRLGLVGILKSRGITQLARPCLDGEVLRTDFFLMVSTLRGSVNALTDVYALTVPDRRAFSMASIRSELMCDVVRMSGECSTIAF